MTGLAFQAPLFLSPEPPPIRFPVVDDVHEPAGGVGVIGGLALEQQYRVCHTLGVSEHFLPVLAVVDHLGHRGDVEGLVRNLLDIAFEGHFTLPGIDDVSALVVALEVLTEFVDDDTVAQADLEDLGPFPNPTLVGCLDELRTVSDGSLHPAIISLRE